MSKIYIGFNYKHEPISLLLAKNREQADIAWAGMSDTPHSIEEIDPDNEDIGIHGLAFILTSVEKKVVNCSSKEFIFRKWKRGL